MDAKDFENRLKSYQGPLDGKDKETLAREINELLDLQVEGIGKRGAICQKVKEMEKPDAYARFLRDVDLTEQEAEAAIGLFVKVLAGEPSKELREMACEISLSIGERQGIGRAGHPGSN